MIHTLLKETQANLRYFFETFDPAPLEKVLDLCLETKGFFFFTGVGKSGIIAEKIATTLSSTGSKAFYLPAQNFLHGDIGAISEGDLVFLLSRSGESEEILQLLPAIHHKKAHTIAITSVPTSSLAQKAHTTIYLPLQKELCPFDLAPTTSTQLQLILGDILAVALMERKAFPLSAYALNHPLGSIGKRMTLRVRDLMITGEQLPTCHAEAKLGDVLVELSHKKCGALLVLHKEKDLAGIFTDGDLRRALQQYGSSVLEKPIASLMTTNALCVESQELAWDALTFMQKDKQKWIMTTPVLEEGKVVGLLRMHDIVHAGLT